MTLYCNACREMHTIAVGDVERIVYTVVVASPPRMCLLQILDWSLDESLYLRDVDVAVTARRGVI